MPGKGRKAEKGLKLTAEEAESMGVELPEDTPPASEARRELPLHEQVLGALTENDVAEALTGEVTRETREEIEEAFADAQEEEADGEGRP